MIQGMSLMTLILTFIWIVSSAFGVCSTFVYIKDSNNPIRINTPLSTPIIADMIAVVGIVAFIMFNFGFATENAKVTENFEISAVNGAYVEQSQNIYIVYAKTTNGTYVPRQFTDIEIIYKEGISDPYVEVFRQEKQLLVLETYKEKGIIYLPGEGK